jgi:hypothetical protein
MITTRAVPAPLLAHIAMSQISQIATGQDFADPLHDPHGGRVGLARASGWHAARPSPTWSAGFPRSSPAWGHSGAQCASTRLPMTSPTSARSAFSTWTRMQAP